MKGNTELRSKIVVEIDTETRGRGDAEKMNMLRMNATWYKFFYLVFKFFTLLFIRLNFPIKIKDNFVFL